LQVGKEGRRKKEEGRRKREESIGVNLMSNSHSDRGFNLAAFGLS
jgi:hypothetical protein